MKQIAFMQGTILRHEVLAEIDTGMPFSMLFITADRRRGTGGHIREVTNWVKMRGDELETRLPAQFRAKNNPFRSKKSQERIKKIFIYDPNNPAHHPYEVHWRLIQFFNNKKVLQ